jgi:hypothetical protein
MLLVTGSTPDTLLRWTNLPFRSTNASFAQKMSPYAPFICERNSDPTHSSVMWRISISFYSPGQILCPVLIASAATLASPPSLTKRFGLITPRSSTSMTSKSSCTDWPVYCEGVGLWASYSNNNNNNKPWEGKGTLPYTLACTVKSRPSSRRHQTAKREEEEKGGLSVLPELG